MKSRVRAIIIEGESILTIKRVKASETYWAFPGGGVEDGEDKVGALVRECKEELGVKVEVEDLMFENLLVRRNGEEQMEYFYNCKIVGGQLGTGEGPEYATDSQYEGTHELEWLKLKELPNLDLRPSEVKSELLKQRI